MRRKLNYIDSKSWFSQGMVKPYAVHVMD